MLIQAKNAVGFDTPGAASSAADFGEVLGGFWVPKMVPTSRFLVFFRICLWRFDFWLNFVRFSIKSMAKNIGIFNGFSRRRFINCCLNLLISSMFEI